MSPKKMPPAQTSPVRLLLGDYHLRLLSLLLLRPSEDFHLREIERRTGVPFGPARRELERFVAAGLVTRRPVGNQVRYQADRKCLVFDELASMLRKTTGLAHVLRDALAPLAGRISAAFIFGSAAEGKEGPFSDIDLMIVGDVAFDEAVDATAGAESQLGRPVNPVIYRLADFRAKLAADKGFVQRVMGGPRIDLMGSLDEPGKPA
jgi:predicted nucleotidyltransferase